MTPAEFVKALRAAFPWGEDEDINGGDVVDWINDNLPGERCHNCGGLDPGHDMCRHCGAQWGMG